MSSEWASDEGESSLLAMPSEWASDGEESSRAREEQPERDEVVELEPRPWVALSSIPVVLGANDERGWMLAPGAADLLLDVVDTLGGACFLVLPDRIVPHPRTFSFPYVVAVCSDRLLFMATTGDRVSGDRVRKFAYFIGDAHTRTAARLPDVPADLLDFGLELALRRSVGLIDDPRHGGHYLVAQLHPTSATRRHDIMLAYSTVNDQWIARPLASSPDHECWGASGVLAHGGFLWWVDIANGMLVCDPFAADEDMHLRFVPLPLGCQMQDFGDRPRPSALMNKLRFVRPSDGMLRYVEILGVPYGYGPTAANDNHPPVNQDQEPALRMFTLVSQDGPDHWSHHFTATFADIWGHPSYAATGLPSGVVPSLAFLDPNNPRLVYFFLDTTLFAVDGFDRQVVRRMDYVVDSASQKLKFQNSCFVDVWELPPGLLLDDDSTSVGFNEGQQPEPEHFPHPHPRDALEADIRCVQEKINREQDFRKLEKLFRQRAHLKELLEKHTD